ncbi:MAG: sigma 54-interacting transcriptional regulator [Gammaproteobacteria bacterium]
MPEPPLLPVSASVNTEQRARAGGAPSTAVLRHDLRQPLNHIIGYSELLLEEAEARELEPFIADLKKIHDAARKLSNLIDSVVTSSANGSGLSGPHRMEIRSPSYSEAAWASLAESGKTDTDRQSGHVLVVDDDPLSGDFLSRQLCQQGYRVTVATDGRKALESIAIDPADLILLDVLMPDMDGFATCAALKADSDTRETPVIFMTALTDTVDKVRGFDLGAVDYITKPFHREEVFARIATHLTLRRLLQRIQESETRLSGIIDSAMDAIITVDRRGEILLFNRAAERVFRCEASEAVGRPVRAFLSESLDRALTDYMGTATSMPPVWLPEGLGGLRADGEAFPVEATLSLSLAMGQPLYTLILRDVQERHRAEAERQRLMGLARYLEDELGGSQSARDIIGSSGDLKSILAQVEQVAPTTAAVLIQGETGTGKEVIARAIHVASERRDKILVKLNCAAIPNDLVESELFGHEKGAFTGALSRKLGRFELADRGTLFLDEVGDLPLAAQGKLLRVLQEGEFERVGSTETRKVDVRIIAATNRDLAMLLEDGRFRPDLFYRLNVFPLLLPPLRERRNDLPLLIHHFVRTYAKKYGKRIEHVPARALAAWQSYAWPGNVRELQHVIERAVILSRSTDLAFDEGSGASAATAPSAPRPLAETLEEAERTFIVEALEASGWRVSGRDGAAERLGLKPSTLEYRIKKLNISRPV